MNVHKLIDKHNQSFSTYYDGGYYSHTPMALIALRDLGATEERLEEFYNIDTKKLEPLTIAKKIINNDNWRDYLGRGDFESSYIEFFRAIVREDGIEKALGKYFDILIKGVGAAAFHPIIRLAYAVKDNNEDEVAISLATWAISFMDLKLNSKLSNENELLEIIKMFQDINFNLNHRIVADSIAVRMEKISTDENYKLLSSTIKLKSLEKESLERSLLWLYSQTDNFTLLHAVTSHHAFESLIHFSINKEEARIYFWKTILAAYLSTTGTVKIDTEWQYPLSLGLPSWNEIKQEAIKSNDEHVIKLVHILDLKNKESFDYELRYASALKLNMLKFK